MKEELVEAEGVIVAALAAGNFKVKLDGGHEVIARIAGRLEKHHIKIVASFPDMPARVRPAILLALRYHPNGQGCKLKCPRTPTNAAACDV